MIEDKITNLAADMSADATPSLHISELYRSIQGESSFTGLPCGFIRLTGCPLRCVWCDTAYAFTGGRRMTIDAIMSEAATWSVGLIEVTGGEPLSQSTCPELLKRLCDAGYEVLLETSGAIDLAPVDSRVVKIVDIKCPGSGEQGANRWENMDLLGPRDELKFVLAGRSDYQWAAKIISERNLHPGGGILFSPVNGTLDPSELAEWILADGLDVRLQIQLHKYLWPDRTQGI